MQSKLHMNPLTLDAWADTGFRKKGVGEVGVTVNY